MVLGIIVTSDRYPHQAIGLVRAALRCGHQVRVFATDLGVRLAAHPEMALLNQDAALEVTYCLHSARQTGLLTEALPEGMRSGSQYNNAKLIRASDKVITV